MVIRSRKGIGSIAALGLLVLLTPVAGRAGIIIQPDLPQKTNVTDTLNVVIDGVAATIMVKIPPGANQRDKAAAIAAALNSAKDGMGNKLFNASTQKGIGTTGLEVKVTAVNPVKGAGSSVGFAPGGNVSMERMDRFGFQTFALNTTAKFSYEGALTGPSSEFHVSVGDDTFVGTADLTFPELVAIAGPDPTIGDLLTAMFGRLKDNLPLDLQPGLSLDRDSGGVPIDVMFAFPSVATNPFIENGSTDDGATQTLSLSAAEVVPEPPSLALLSLGGLGFLGLARRRDSVLKSA